MGNCHSLIGLSTVQGGLNEVQEGDRSLLSRVRFREQESDSIRLFSMRNVL
jgi:hypothetical protein